MLVPPIQSSVAKANSTYDHSFAVKGPKMWNCLPKHIKDCGSIISFKEKLDVFLLGIPDCPPVHGYFTMNTNSVLDWLTSSNAL